MRKEQFNFEARYQLTLLEVLKWKCLTTRQNVVDP